MAVPYTFGNATTSIPLSQLDTNFATAITIGNTAVYLGNTTTTFGNVTLNNVTINSGNSTVTKETVTTITSPAATALTIQSAGTTAMTIDTSQFVGIGTASPANLLDVASAGSANQARIGTKSGTSANDAAIIFRNVPSATAGTRLARIYFDANGGDGSGGDYFNIIAYGDGSAVLMNQSNSYTSFGTNGTERMRIDSSGNVGVGTSSPSAKLDVLGSTTGDLIVRGSTGRGNIITNTGAADSSGILVGTTTFQGGASTSGSAESRLSIIASGTEGSTANNRGGNIQFYTKQSNSNTINEAMRIDSSGNVGIGTSSPAYKLDVNGGIRMPNATVFWLNNSSGTAQETLQLFTDNNTYLSTPGALILRTNGTTERMRINSSGNLLVGGTSPTAYETNTKLKLNSSGTAEVFNQLQLVNSGSPAGVGDIVGIGFAAGETTAYGVKGSIGYVRTADYGRGAITFYTNNTAGTASVSTSDERMRIDSSGNLLVGTTTASTLLTVAGAISLQAPSTKTANYSMAATDSSLIFNGSGSITLTLQAASSYSGRMLYVKTIAAQTVVSASSNVVPLAGGAAGTAILAATAGKWAILQSDGTNWIIMASN